MANTPNTRLHVKGSVLEVVTAGVVICNHGTELITELVVERPLWATPYFPTFITRLTGYLGSYVGDDRTDAQRDATVIVEALEKQARAKLSSFKIQLDADFRTNKPRLAEILNTLGFTLYFKNAIISKEVNLLNLLERFKTNMIPTLQAEIVTAGGNLANIILIKTLATTLPAANMVQEGLKGTKKLTTEGMVTDFNDAYDELMSICKVAQNIYKEDAAKKQLFSYAHTLSILRGGTPAVVVPPVVVPPVDPPVDPPTN